MIWDRLRLEPDRLHLLPLGRRRIMVRRSDVAALEFERVFALVWIRTTVHIRLTDGTYVEKVHVPFSGRWLERRALRLGWPAEDVQLGQIARRDRRRRD